MEKNEVRAVIKFFVLEGLSATEIHAKLVRVLKDSAPSYATVCRWTVEFKRGRTSVDDDPRSGRPKSALNTEVIEKIQDMVMADRRLTEDALAEATGISHGSVHEILRNVLGMRKLMTRWVPHLLSLEQKRTREKLSAQHLARFTKNKNDFLRRFITMDETWVYHYDPELRQQTAEWTEPSCSAPKQPKWSKSSKKIMASIFWDAKGILLVDYLQTGKTITGEYYCNLLDQLDEKIREKRPGLQKKKVIFHHDNAPAHRGALATAKLVGLQYELLEHPPYSPDLAPSDFHLFPNLKRFLRGKRFSTDNEVITAVEGYFEGLPESHFRDGVNELETRWKKCIELKGDYTE